jgi:hypothetical protein
MSIVSRAGLQKGKKGKIGPISEPRDGRPLNSDFMREGGPISLSAIGRRDVNVDTAPEAARRREERRHDVEDVRMEGETEKDVDELDMEETEADLEEKINQGHEAWREGDAIIIEDEDGEVIQTINSPEEHHMKFAADKFGQAAMDKLSQVESDAKDEVEGIKGKLKRMWSGGKKEPNEGRRRSVDLEQGIPEDDENVNVIEKRSSTEKRSSVESYKPTPKNSPPKPPSGPAFVVDEDNRRTGHVNERTQRRAMEERDEETAVERRRREAVLGPSHDSEDEGPPHPYYPAVSRSKGKQPESSSDEDDEEYRIPSSRSQSSSDRAESSGSGAQLVQQPLPARTRGIRFGDINVGQESFSLAEGPPSTGARHHKTGSVDWRVRWRSDNK